MGFRVPSPSLLSHQMGAAVRGGGGAQLPTELVLLKQPGAHGRRSGQCPGCLRGADYVSFVSGASTLQSPAQNPKCSKKGGKTSFRQRGRGSITLVPPGGSIGRIPHTGPPLTDAAGPCRPVLPPPARGQPGPRGGVVYAAMERMAGGRHAGK